jgi:hypothetical protein
VGDTNIFPFHPPFQFKGNTTVSSDAVDPRTSRGYRLFTISAFHGLRQNSFRELSIFLKPGSFHLPGLPPVQTDNNHVADIDFPVIVQILGNPSVFAGQAPFQTDFDHITNIAFMVIVQVPGRSRGLNGQIQQFYIS